MPFLCMVPDWLSFIIYPTGAGRVVVSIKLRFLHNEINRHDIVLARVPGRKILMLKRVVGLPGDVIGLHDDGCMDINGSPLFEGQPTDASTDNIEYPLLLDDNEYYLLGDNYEYSKDFRYFGPFDRSMIVEKVIWYY